MKSSEKLDHIICKVDEVRIKVAKIEEHLDNINGEINDQKKFNDNITKEVNSNRTKILFMSGAAGGIGAVTGIAVSMLVHLL